MNPAQKQFSLKRAASNDQIPGSSKNSETEMMNMKETLSLKHNTLASLSLAAGFLAAGVVYTANANLLLNGSFENPPRVGGDGYGGPVSDWVQSSGGVVRGNLGLPFPNQVAGSQYTLMEPLGTIQQVFTVSIGGGYQMTWLDNQLIGGTTSYSVSVKDSSLFTVASDNVGPYPGAATWNARSLSMTLVPDSYTLLFSSTDSYYMLDNVDVSVVPEPTTMTIIAGALPLLLGANRLRRLRKSHAA